MEDSTNIWLRVEDEEGNTNRPVFRCLIGWTELLGIIFLLVTGIYLLLHRWDEFFYTEDKQWPKKSFGIYVLVSLTADAGMYAFCGAVVLAITAICGSAGFEHAGGCISVLIFFLTSIGWTIMLVIGVKLLYCNYSLFRANKEFLIISYIVVESVLAFAYVCLAAPYFGGIIKYICEKVLRKVRREPLVQWGGHPRVTVMSEKDLEAATPLLEMEQF